MYYSGKDHTFVVCAYNESEYLEDCIKSLLSQTVKSNILISTSTLNNHIIEISKKYNIPLFVNCKKSRLGSDWNYAYLISTTPLLTLVHQDDIYEPDYVSSMLKAMNFAENPIIFFSDYSELRNGEKVLENKLLKTKRIMLKPFTIKRLQSSIFVRRRILSLGCPICCPSVTFVKEKVGEKPFGKDFCSNIDWQLWEKLSKKKGAFVYSQKMLVSHRIHQKTETTRLIKNKGRLEEDYKMFLVFWPKIIAKILIRFYSKSQASNDI